ncbi:MAG: DNA polymerase III subunit epsilon [Mesorhizobium sp.]|nr:MAG: DNA polymerase III subunit epsilon [Mesorhizobium sp.]
MADPFTLIRVVDTETTGLDDPAEMVEAGWTDVRLFPTGWAIESGPHARLVNPGIPITFPAMAVHHITEEMAGGGMAPDEARALITAGADILCAHNVEFDSRFIRGHNLPWVCTLKGARTAWPELQSHKNGSIRYERGLCLDDERTEPSHRAGPDTWVTAHILLDLLKLYPVETLIEMSTKPVLLLKVDFGEHAGKRWSEVPMKYLNWILNLSKMPEDPKKADVVFTARHWWVKHTSDPTPAQQRSPPSVEPDPDAWRKEMERR